MLQLLQEEASPAIEALKVVGDPLGKMAATLVEVGIISIAITISFITSFLFSSLERVDYDRFIVKNYFYNYN